MYGPNRRCLHCGSENHWTEACPPRKRAPRTCTVYAKGETTEYVSKEDYDRAIGDYDQLVLVHEALQVASQKELEKVRSESDWRWYKDHIEALQRRYEAELDLYRKPPGMMCCGRTCDCDHCHHALRRYAPCKCRS